MAKVFDALKSLRPGCRIVVVGNTYEGVQWLDDTQEKPSKAEVEAEVARLQAEYDAQKYARNRAAEYPPIGDQLDALWKGGDAAAEMLATVQAVKAKYPKPIADAE